MKLNRNQVVSLKQKSTLISCIKGRVWITYKNGQDEILSQGESSKYIKAKDIKIVSLESSLLKIS